MSLMIDGYEIITRHSGGPVQARLGRVGKNVVLIQAILASSDPPDPRTSYGVDVNENNSPLG